MSDKSPTREGFEERLNSLLQRDWRLLIGGQLLAGSGDTMTITSPADGRLLGQVPLATVGDVDKAVQAAEKVFPSWSTTALVDRIDCVRHLIKVLAQFTVDLAVLDAIDCGNPVTAMIGDVGMATNWLEYQLSAALEVKGETIPSKGSNWLLTKREPYGVVGRIIPFNHPILFTAGKIGAPVLMGNTLVLKVPDQAPLSSLYLAEKIAEVFPPGVVNIISGNGQITGEALVRHPRVKRIALIGSVPTGQRVLKAAAESGIKHVSLELGGKNPMIVFPDADLDKAAEGAAFGMNFHWSQSQSCGSTTRLFVHSDIHDSLIDKLLARVSGIRIGHPLNPDTEMGTLVSKEQFSKVSEYTRSAIEEGAALRCGGKRPDGEDYFSGYYYLPTVFDHVTMDMKVAREEIFGPILSVLRWSNADDVLAQANSLEYGLTGSVWTSNIASALSVADNLDVGYVWINGSGSHFLGAPFSGHKNSGIGSEEGIEELYSYTQTKTVSILG